MAFSSVERDLRKEMFAKQLQGRAAFSDYLGRTDLKQQALNPSYFQGLGEGIFTGQARGIAAETRLRMDQAMTGLQGLGSGIAERGRASLGAASVGQIAGVRRQVNTQAADLQTRAEASFMDALNRLAEMDISILETKRDYATRAFEANQHPDIEASMAASTQYALEKMWEEIWPFD